MGWVLVFTMRLLVPLSIVRFPLAGGVIVIIGDNLDWHILHLFPPVDYISYQQYDKFLDTYYLAIEFLISLTWKEKIVRYTSVVLFLYRVIGVMLFELTNNQYLLFVFPNIFESFYLFYLLYKMYTTAVFSYRNAYIVFSLLLLAISKYAFEYLLHVAQVPLTDILLSEVSLMVPFLPR